MNENLFFTQVAIYDNDLAALKPEWWAMEGLAVLEEELVVANLVNRDYDNYFVNAGDTVHVHKPGKFSAKHKERGQDTTVQDATASDTTVKLDQHLETTFLLDDREIQESMADLVTLFLRPAIRSIATGVDRAIVGTTSTFYPNAVGEIGVALDDDSVIDLAARFDANNVPFDGRNLVVGPSGKADLLRIDRFSDADKRGDQSLLLNGQIGGIMGFNVFMSQTVGSGIAPGVTTSAEAGFTGTIGANSAAITAAGDDYTAGSWFKIADVPGVYRLTAAVTEYDETLAFEPALKANATNKAVTFYQSDGEVKAAHDAGDIKVVTDTYTSAGEIPKVGASVSFGTGANAPVYTITDVSGTWANTGTEITLTLHKPLEADLADNAVINVMPVGGNYNFALRPDAVTLVNRPLAPARASVASAVQDNGTFALRVTIGYDMIKMKHRITVDTLLGVKVLDVDQGAILFN